MSKILVVLTLLFSGLSVVADSLFQLPSGRFACAVDLTAGPTAGGGGPTFKHIDITRDGDLQRDVVSWANGATAETWRVLNVGLIVADNKDSPGAVIIFHSTLPAAGFLTPRILALDSGSLSWITPGSLVGTESKNGKSTLHYRATVSVPALLQGAPPRQVAYEAWIDTKTLLPVAFSDSDYLCDLTFSPLVPDVLVMPARLKTAFDTYERYDAIAMPR